MRVGTIPHLANHNPAISSVPQVLKILTSPLRDSAIQVLPSDIEEYFILFYIIVVVVLI